MMTVEMQPHTKGGIDRSWAPAAEKPRLLIIVGVKRATA